MTGDVPTARRVGALPQSHPGLFGTLVGPGKDTHGTPVPLQRKAVGGPQQASHDNTETTRPRFTASRLDYQQKEKQTNTHMHINMCMLDHTSETHE